MTVSAPDQNVERNRQLLLERAEAGLQKYGVTTERSDLTQQQWLQHLLEELLDAANYVQAAMHNSQPGLTPAARVVKHQLFGTQMIEQLIKLEEGETLYRSASTPVATAPQADQKTDKITVTRSALKEVLTCLISAPHLIRELQATRMPEQMFPDNPINVLLADYNGQVKP